jgi:regulator of sigma E protease
MLLISVLSFVFAIGVLVAVHEWGHYIVARIAGVKVLRFSVGFGRPIWLRRGGPDQTEYCVSAIPLGGYVKLLDEREGTVSPQDRHRTFNSQPIFARIAILVAGPAMNFIFAIAAFWFMYQVGIPGLAPVIGQVESGSIAADAGIRDGDRIVAINQQPVATWEGAALGLLDAILEDPAVQIEVRGQLNSAGVRVLSINTSDRLGELTEPGALLPGIGITVWSPVIEPVIGEIVAGGSAEAAGLQVGDRVVSSDGIAVQDWAGWVNYVRARPNQNVQIDVRRSDALLSLNLRIGAADDDGKTIGRIGAGVSLPDDLYAGFRAEQRYTGLEGLRKAVQRTWSMSELTVRMVARMVTGDVSARNISGPINIAQYAGYSASIGLTSFLSFLAVVSLSLGIINLLPVPVLDGGQVVYQVAEAIKGRPLSERTQALGQQIGIAFLVLIMSFAFYNDLSRFFS